MCAAIAVEPSGKGLSVTCSPFVRETPEGTDMEYLRLPTGSRKLWSSWLPLSTANIQPVGPANERGPATSRLAISWTGLMEQFDLDARAARELRALPEIERSELVGEWLSTGTSVSRHEAINPIPSNTAIDGSCMLELSNERSWRILASKRTFTSGTSGKITCETRCAVSFRKRQTPSAKKAIPARRNASAWRIGQISHVRIPI